MENLEITDADDGSFTLEQFVDKAVIAMDCGLVDIAYPDAVKMVAWLNERFDLERELEADAFGELTITVPGVAGGATREVRWEGSGDAPAWLERLAEIAIAGQMTAQQRDQASKTHYLDDCEYQRTCRSIYALVQTLGMRQQVGAYDTVEQLVDAHRKLRRDAAAAAPAKAPIALMVECGGATSEQDALKVLRGWKGQIDASVQVLHSHLPSADRLISDLPTLVRHLVAQHNGRLAQLREQHERARAQYEQSRIDNNERGLAKEREARAQVQAKLDIARDALRSVQLNANLQLNSRPGDRDLLDVVNKALNATSPDA